MTTSLAPNTGPSAAAPGSERAASPYRLAVEVDSTQRWGLDEAAAGAPHGLLLVALRQTAGRGQRGRRWSSPEGGLYASLVLRPSWPTERWGLLSLAAGVAMAEALLTQCRLRVELRWPNDLYGAGRKLGGLLAEVVPGPNAGPNAVVLGVGVNLSGRGVDRLGAENIATTVAEAGGIVLAHTAWELALEWAQRLRRETLEVERCESIPEAWRRLASLGTDMQLADGRQGRCVGVGPDGALLLEVGAERVAVRSSAELARKL